MSEIENNEILSLKIYYKKIQYGYSVYSEKEFEESDIVCEEKTKYLSLVVKMKRLTWGTYNELQEYATQFKNGDFFWNNKLYKENKLKNLIVGWNAKRKNEKGVLEDVAVNEREILNLSPEIAEKILKIYDSLTIIDEQEERVIAGKIHSFVKSNGMSSTSISKEIIENDLIEEHHWLPQDIEKIPYKKLQLLFLIKREKQAARSQKNESDARAAKLKNGGTGAITGSAGSGQTKRR